MADELRLYGETVPMGRPPARVLSDEDRERTIGWLRHHCGLGTLTLDEFAERAGAVYAAGTDMELWHALDGLDVPHSAAHVPEPKVTPAASRRAGRRWHVAIFGSADRRGRWRISTSSIAVSVFGSVDLDLRSVSLEDPDATEIKITSVAVFGGVVIYVPEGMEVETSGLSIFGGKDCRLADVAVNPSLPVLRVRALAIFGGVDVRSRKSVAEKKATRQLRHG